MEKKNPRHAAAKIVIPAEDVQGSPPLFTETEKLEARIEALEAAISLTLEKYGGVPAVGYLEKTMEGGK